MLNIAYRTRSEVDLDAKQAAAAADDKARAALDQLAGLGALALQDTVLVAQIGDPENLPSGGGLGDAPADGTLYARQGGVWTAAATAAQGGRADTAVQPGALAAVAFSGAYGDLAGLPPLGTLAAVDDAPADGDGYVRRDGGWSRVPENDSIAQNITVQSEGVEIAGAMGSLNITGAGISATADAAGNVTLQVQEIAGLEGVLIETLAVDAGVLTTAAAPSAATGVLPNGTAVASIRLRIATGLGAAPTLRLAHAGEAIVDAQLAAALDAIDWTTPGTYEVLAPRVLRTDGAGALAAVVTAPGSGGFDVEFAVGVPQGAQIEAAADRDVELAGGHLRIPAPTVPIVVSAVAGATGTVQILGGLGQVTLGPGLGWHGDAPQPGASAVFAAYGPTPDGTAMALYLAGES